VGIERSGRRIAADRLERVLRKLLEASTLCAIATVSGSRAHINTAYFAWSEEFHLVWVSEPRARHSQNLRQRRTAAIAVFDSTQVWGKPDRGVQLFGSAGEPRGRAAERARDVYAGRFREYDAAAFSAYRVYEFRPQRLKLFDETEFGGGVFVTARVRGGALSWQRTEIYSGAD
jgi:uncharacterized protein YhbP (UPF0306 family)